MPAHKRLIAFEPNFRAPRQWTGGTNTSHISPPIPLQGGYLYYVEALMQEATRADNFAVAWQLPGRPVPVNGSDPISFQHLRAYPATDVVTNDSVYLTVIASDPQANENPNAPSPNGNFLIQRYGPRTDAVTANLVIAGTAANGVDYQLISNRLTITAGVSARVLSVVPTADAAPEGDETVVLTLRGRPGVRLLIEASSDLVSWTALGEATTGAGPVRFVDPAAGQFPRRFYRAKEER